MESKEKKNKKGPGTGDSAQDGQGVDVVDTSDYKVTKDGKKYKAHRIIFNKGEDDGTKGVHEDMKKSFNKFLEQHTPALTEQQLDEIVVELQEVLGKSDDAGKWISDFVHSDNPKFAGKSKEKRKQMALAAYYSAQRNEEVDVVEELTEAYDADDYEASHEKSQFGGHRAVVKHKATGREIYVGGTAYKSAEHAKGEAEAYRTHYSVGSGKAQPGANYRHDRAVSDYRKKAKEAGHLREALWPGTAEYKKKFDNDRVTGAGARHDIKKTATGVIATRRFADNDTAEKPKDEPKRGRGRPKKDKFAEAVEFLIALDEETFDSLMEEGFDSFMEQYEQLDEISKATLGSYIKKAGRDAVIQRKIGADFEHQADKSRKPGMKASATALADKYKAKSWSRSHNVNKAVDRLTK